MISYVKCTIMQLSLTAIPYKDYRFEILEEQRLGYIPFLLQKKNT